MDNSVCKTFTTFPNYSIHSHSSHTVKHDIETECPEKMYGDLTGFVQQCKDNCVFIAPSQDTSFFTHRPEERYTLTPLPHVVVLNK